MHRNLLALKYDNENKQQQEFSSFTTARRGDLSCALLLSDRVIASAGIKLQYSFDNCECRCSTSPSCNRLGNVFGALILQESCAIY